MDDWERLRAAFDRVKEFPEFNPKERAFWLELRAAVERWLERNEDETVRNAHNGVKCFPEAIIHEASWWIALRDTIANTLSNREKMQAESMKP